MTALALLFTLAAIGVSETVYLIKKRRASEHPVCPIGGGCEKVLNSQYNKTLGIHNDVLGLLGYTAIGFVSAFLVMGYHPTSLWKLALEILVGFATLMSAFFVYLQWRVIKSWCFWCLMSALTITFMGLIILVSPSIKLLS